MNELENKEAEILNFAACYIALWIISRPWNIPFTKKIEKEFAVLGDFLKLEGYDPENYGVKALPKGPYGGMDMSIPVILGPAFHMSACPASDKRPKISPLVIRWNRVRRAMTEYAVDLKIGNIPGLPGSSDDWPRLAPHVCNSGE